MGNFSPAPMLTLGHSLHIGDILGCKELHNRVFSSIGAPMLCHDLEVNGSVLKGNGLDGERVTAAYRKAVSEGLSNLMVRGFVAEWKGGIAASQDTFS